MAPRIQLQAALEALLGSANVYFQPPASKSIEYPCIVYKRDAAVTQFANDHPYSYYKRYLVTIITEDPDSDIPDKVAALPMCTFSRHFTAKHLHHDVFNLYF